MKNAKKLLALLLAVVMVIALGVSAYGQTEGTAAAGTGSITIKNASRGDTYKFFKLFDATITEVPASGEAAGIAYTGDIPAALANYFVKDSVGNIHIATHGDPPVEWTDSEIIAAVQAWADAQPDTAAVATVVSDGSKLVVQGLSYGYYAVTSTLGATVTIDSTNPNAEIIDKNSNTPSAYKVADAEEYSVGDTVIYTAVFDAPNYLPSKTAGGDPEQVVSYKIQDSLPNFLTNVAITSVQIGKFDKNNNYAVIGDLQDDLSASYTAFDSNKTIEIPWVNESVPTNDHTYTSKYTSNTQIKITYTAVLTANTQLVNDNENKVSLFPQVDRGDGKKPYQEEDEWNATDSITTYGAAIQKKDNKNGNLAGAEFRVKGLTVTGANGLYTVVSYNPNAAEGTGTVMVTDSNGLLRIGGLKSALSLSVTETKAPDGYNMINPNPFTLTTTTLGTTTTSSSGSVTRYYDADGNLVNTEAEATSTVTTTEYTSIENIPADSIQVIINNPGQELPSTGGIGTTIFYIIGGILVVGAGVVLVARKKTKDD